MRSWLWGVVCLVIGFCAAGSLLKAERERPTVSDSQQKQLDKLSKRVDEADKNIALVQAQVGWKADNNTRVRIDPAVSGYQRLDTESGSFLVALDKVEPYLDGYKAFLRIGCLGSAHYIGFKLSGIWAPREENRSDEIQNREQNYTQILLPTQWNRVEFILPKTKSDQVGFLNLGLEVATLNY